MRGLLQHSTESFTIPASIKRSVWRNKKAPKQDVSFLRGRQIAYLIYEYFWVTGTCDSVEYHLGNHLSKEALLELPVLTGSELYDMVAVKLSLPVGCMVGRTSRHFLGLGSVV